MFLISASFAGFLSTAAVFASIQVQNSIPQSSHGGWWFISAIAAFILGKWVPCCVQLLVGDLLVEALASVASHPVIDDVERVYGFMDASPDSDDVQVLCVYALISISSSSDGLWSVRDSGGLARIALVQKNHPDNLVLQALIHRALDRIAE